MYNCTFLTTHHPTYVRTHFDARQKWRTFPVRIDHCWDGGNTGATCGVSLADWLLSCKSPIVASVSTTDRWTSGVINEMTPKEFNCHDLFDDWWIPAVGGLNSWSRGLAESLLLLFFRVLCEQISCLWLVNDSICTCICVCSHVDSGISYHTLYIYM